MVLHLSFAFWQSWQMREETWHFCQTSDDLAKADRSLLPRGFWSPARLRLLFAPYRGNFHRDISRHKVPIGLRLLFATQSLTTRRRPPREETPPHAPPSRSRHKVSMCRRSPRDRNTSTRVVVRCRSRRIAPPEATSSRPPSIPPTPTFNASSRPPNVHHTSASSQIAHVEDGYVSLSSPGSYQSW